LLKGLLKKESKIVRRSSIKVLRELEKINDDIDRDATNAYKELNAEM
jgi:hypothetical protein